MARYPADFIITYLWVFLEFWAVFEGYENRGCPHNSDAIKSLFVTRKSRQDLYVYDSACHRAFMRFHTLFNPLILDGRYDFWAFFIEILLNLYKIHSLRLTARFFSVKTLSGILNR